MLKEKIRKLAAEAHANAIANRRHLHTYPELSFREHKTIAFIAEKLKELDIPFEKKTETGIVALLQGGQSASDQIIALRADIDALPIRELNEVEYRSKNEGVMHACGHDVHTSSLLATAGILSHMRNEFSGTVKFIFQPGEELIPGGASLMIKAGALDNPRPSGIIGQHVMPEMPAGKVGFRSGKYMAGHDDIYVTVKGKGGHGAMPQLTIDPVLIACHIITALQQIVSRCSSPLIPSVLSFGKIIANGATNVIPDEVHIEGTFRTLDEEWRAEAHRKMEKMAVAIAEGMGGSCEFEIRKGYPVLVNEEKITATTRGHAEEFLGKANVLDLDIWMAAEDFAFYSREMDACFYRLGVRNDARNITSGLHTATFDADESSLETGSGLMAYLALKNLGN
jgi:amidohydrolase